MWFPCLMGCVKIVKCTIHFKEISQHFLKCLTFPERSFDLFTNMYMTQTEGRYPDGCCDGTNCM